MNESNPDRTGTWVIDIFIIGEYLKPVKGFVVIYDFDVSSIPYIITVTNHFTEFFHNFPIVITFKFKAQP